MTQISFCLFLYYLEFLPPAVCFDKFLENLILFFFFISKLTKQKQQMTSQCFGDKNLFVTWYQKIYPTLQHRIVPPEIINLIFMG